MTKSVCPNCLKHNAENFFMIKNAPAQSLVAINNYYDAISIPKRDIALSFCHDCGFIFNSIFDTSINHYTTIYEDQQGFSPTFVRFLTETSQRFIDKYDVRDKDILEVGCGKGEFLSLFCELGRNRGIGIDPVYTPGRVPPNDNIRFIPQFYPTEHENLPTDVLVCRHTLEHIPKTDELLSTFRKSIGDKKDVILYFEVPNIVRVLEIQAFWDIFNEHCNYFSPGSLARLFRNNDFEVLDIYLEYDNQYLFIEARPVAVKSKKIHPQEETVEELKALVDHFVSSVNDHLGEWRKKLLRFKEENKQVVLWGGGSKSVGFLTWFHELGVISHVVDINPHMQGNFIPGIGIQYISPDNLREIRPDVVVVMNGVYRNEIRKILIERGLDPELICLDDTVTVTKEEVIPEEI